MLAGENCFEKVGTALTVVITFKAALGTESIEYRDEATPGMHWLATSGKGDCSEEHRTVVGVRDSASCKP